MKNYKQISNQSVRLFMIILTLVGKFAGLYAQGYSSLSGTLADSVTKEAIPYAAIALFTTYDSKLITGQLSDSAGHFILHRIPPGKYSMLISMAGYQRMSKMVDVSSGRNYEAGTILMKSSVIGIGETVIKADRLKGKSDKDRTTYFVTKKMTDASSNGLDLVKLVPGVQVDFKRNIMLEGSRNILILVDGIERDNNYLSQVMPELIDKIEILSAPPSRYDGNVTGVINIILRKEKNLGISGLVNLEIPGSSFFYLHPDYSLNMDFKKLNIYTSYNGEMISFDQHESLRQEYSFVGKNMKTKSDQYIRQNLWSHRFHYGFDFPLTSKSRLNFYGFFNPYCQKYEGSMESISDRNPELWQGSRVSADKSKSNSYSLFFKHMFNDKGNDLSIDISNYNYSGNSAATYSTPELKPILNDSRPRLNTFNVKIDVNAVLTSKLNISAGARVRMQSMKELNYESFKYSENIFAVYSSLEYNRSRFDLSSGIRVEKSVSELKSAFMNHRISVLPYTMLNFKISTDKTLKLGFNKTVYRPNLYQLNPISSLDDPNNIRQGNPYLEPEIRTTCYIEYSKKIKTNYGSARIFYNQNNHVISNLSCVNDSSLIETSFENAGKILQSGFQVSGTFKIGSLITFVPYLRLYSNYCAGNKTAKKYFIKNRHQFVIEPGLSTLISFNHDINLSLVFQYAGPRNSIQSRSFSDAFYLTSLDKVFMKRLKTGIAIALPFASNFTYQGSEMRSMELQSKYTGDICLSGPLFWFKLGYQFNSGKRPDKAGRTADESEMLPRKSY